MQIEIDQAPELGLRFEQDGDGLELPVLKAPMPGGIWTLNTSEAVAVEFTGPSSIGVPARRQRHTPTSRSVSKRRTVDATHTAPGEQAVQISPQRSPSQNPARQSASESQRSASSPANGFSAVQATTPPPSTSSRGPHASPDGHASSSSHAARHVPLSEQPSAHSGLVVHGSPGVPSKQLVRQPSLCTSLPSSHSSSRARPAEALGGEIRRRKTRRGRSLKVRRGRRRSG